MVILTSFKNIGDFDGKKFSVARWQPKGFNIWALDFLAAEGAGGVELHLRDFKDPLKEFAAAYREGLKERWSKVETWLGEIDPEESIVLACWCPYSKATQEQMSRFGSFCCHTGLIGRLVQKFRPDVDVVMDSDRLNYLVKEWRPNE